MAASVTLSKGDKEVEVGNVRPTASDSFGINSYEVTVRDFIRYILALPRTDGGAWCGKTLYDVEMFAVHEEGKRLVVENDPCIPWRPLSFYINEDEKPYFVLKPVTGDGRARVGAIEDEAPSGEKG